MALCQGCLRTNLKGVRSFFAPPQGCMAVLLLCRCVYPLSPLVLHVTAAITPSRCTHLLHGMTFVQQYGLHCCLDPYPHVISFLPQSFSFPLLPSTSATLLCSLLRPCACACGAVVRLCVLSSRYRACVSLCFFSLLLFPSFFSLSPLCPSSCVWYRAASVSLN